MFSLEGKVGIVTGARGQLGRSFSSALVEAGARIVGLDVCKNQEGEGPWEDILEVDIREQSQVARAFESIVERFGRLDFLVNNAGAQVFTPFLDRSDEELRLVTNVNLFGTFHCIREFARKFHETKGERGAIVNIGSLYGVVSPDFRIYTDTARNSSEIYAATKAGVIQMTKYFAVHLASQHIRTNCISPGGIFNPANPQGEDFRSNYASRCPMVRMGEVQELTGALVYLVSEASTYTNGLNMVIDGGFSAW